MSLQKNMIYLPSAETGEGRGFGPSVSFDILSLFGEEGER